MKQHISKVMKIYWITKLKYVDRKNKIPGYDMIFGFHVKFDFFEVAILGLFLY